MAGGVAQGEGPEFKPQYRGGGKKELYALLKFPLLFMPPGSSELNVMLNSEIVSYGYQFCFFLLSQHLLSCIFFFFEKKFLVNLFLLNTDINKKHTAYDL
jgi:hypothetical protein